MPVMRYFELRQTYIHSNYKISVVIQYTNILLFMIILIMFSVAYVIVNFDMNSYK